MVIITIIIVKLVILYNLLQIKKNLRYFFDLFLLYTDQASPLFLIIIDYSQIQMLYLFPLQFLKYHFLYYYCLNFLLVAIKVYFILHSYSGLHLLHHFLLHLPAIQFLIIYYILFRY